MFNLLSLNKSRIYPIFVVSTMSSGKSTLINALAGRNILPSQNRVCTARTLGILDNDRMDGFMAHIVTKDGKYIKEKTIEKNTVISFNDTDDISELILEGQIEGIKNSKKSMFLIDTPGVNNSADSSHEDITKDVIEKFDEGLVLYVINAHQIGTYDDSIFLDWIADKIKRNPALNIIFAVNKMDLIDPEKESPGELISNCKKYIEDKGISNPTIIPVSSSYALLFKKALQGTELTEFEENEFFRGFKRFRSNCKLSLVDYMETIHTGDLSLTCDIDGEKFTRASIFAALYNTGIPSLENIIERILVKASKPVSPKVSFIKKEVPKKKKTKKASGKNSNSSRKLVTSNQYNFWR